MGDEVECRIDGLNGRKCNVPSKRRKTVCGFWPQFNSSTFFRTLLIILVWEAMMLFQYIHLRGIQLSTWSPTTIAATVFEVVPSSTTPVITGVPAMETTRRTSWPNEAADGGPTCRIDPSMLRGYSPEEVATFFTRETPLLNCPILYRPYSSLVQNNNNNSTVLVLDERREQSSGYVYATYPTAREGAWIHGGANVIQWRDLPNSTQSSSSVLVVPIREQDEIIFVKKMPSVWNIRRDTRVVTRQDLRTTRVHLRAAHRPAIAQAQSKTRAAWLQQGQQQRVLLDSTNVNVLHLDYDSVSRQHFRRMMPLTTAILDRIALRGNGTTHELFDFQVHNVIGDNTAPNMVPYLYGWEDDKQHDKYLYNEKTKHYRRSNTQSLFEAAKEAGFVTAYIQDDIRSGLAHQSINPAHHTPNQAWTFLKLAVLYDDLGQDTRCLGDRPSSQLVFEYVQSFLDAYKDQATFTFAHISDGHETTGTVIQSADAPLAAFLQSVLNGDSAQDTAIILSGDHGMRYGGWRKSTKGFLEHKLPPLYMILPHKITKKFPEEMKALRANTGLINSKLDLHVTLKDLFGFPKDRRQPSSQSSKINAQTLLQPLPPHRTCADAGIPQEFCSCTPWRLQSPVTHPPGTIGNPSPEQMVSIVVHEILEMLGESEEKNLCSRKLKVHSIDFDGLLVQEIEPSNFASWDPRKHKTLQRNFKVAFTTIVSEDLPTFVAGSSNGQNTTDEFITTWEGILNLRVNDPEDLDIPPEQGFPSRAGSTFPSEIYTVRSIERPSEWPMNCRNQAIAVSIDPKYCVCPQAVA